MRNMQDRFVLTPFFLDEPLPGLRKLMQTGWTINQSQLPAGNKQVHMSAIHHYLADFTAKTISDGKRPVSIAGDCCTAIGVLAGLQHAGISPILIWFDAHGDFNTWETTPSGFIGGMPLAMIVGRGEQTMLKSAGLRPLPEAQVILTDARDLDDGEEKLLKTSGVNHLTDAKNLLDISFTGSPIYIHFDTDIVNAKEAPAMNYPAAGGPTATELEKIFFYLANTNQICAVSMSTWNPRMDKDGQSQKVCMELLDVLIGNKKAHP
jgi:arginase